MCLALIKGANNLSGGNVFKSLYTMLNAQCSIISCKSQVFVHHSRFHARGEASRNLLSEIKFLYPKTFTANCSKISEANPE